MEMLILAAALPFFTLDPPTKIDLAISRPCTAAAEDGEIVVCARPDANERFRYRDMSVEQPTILPRAEVRLNDSMNLAVTGETAGIGGFQSRRAMVRFRLKF